MSTLSVFHLTPFTKILPKPSIVPELLAKLSPPPDGGIAGPAPALPTLLPPPPPQAEIDAAITAAVSIFKGNFCMVVSPDLSGQHCCCLQRHTAPFCFFYGAH
jgi:hypothetical protein